MKNQTQSNVKFEWLHDGVKKHKRGNNAGSCKVCRSARCSSCG